MNKWMNYGDINFLDYGGILLQADENNPRAFSVLYLITPDSGADGFYLASGYIDTDDEWIDYKYIQKTLDIKLDKPDDKAVSALEYYDMLNFNGYLKKYLNKNEVKSALEEYRVKFDEDIIAE